MKRINRIIDILMGSGTLWTHKIREKVISIRVAITHLIDLKLKINYKIENKY